MTGLVEPVSPRALCRLDDIPDGGSKAFDPAAGGFNGLFAVRRGDSVYVFVNSCPHIGVPLNWRGDDFLTRDKAHIICATHGAEFRVTTGECLIGPCVGDHLETVAATITDGVVLVPHDAGL